MQNNFTFHKKHFFFKCMISHISKVNSFLDLKQNKRLSDTKSGDPLDTMLKLVYVIFYHFFISNQMIALQNYEKCFLFHLKSSFRSQDIQIFVFPSSPLFLPVSHCFRGWSKINLKVYDIINCLNKNLIIHFVWYLEKEKRYNIETLSIDRVLNEEHFYGKIMQKMCTKS